MRSRFDVLIIASLIALAGCQTDSPPIRAAALSAEGPVRISPELNPAQRLEHSRGASFFQRPWVTAPSTTTDRDGLGPLFNAHSCESCHKNFGRGTLPQQSTLESGGLLFRVYDSEKFGEQLQTRAIAGLNAETQVEIRREKVALRRQFSDGTLIELIAPDYALGNSSEHAALSPRLAPPLFGQGLLNALPDSAFQKLADPEDKNGDGISGRFAKLDGRPGRFGWKAEQADLRSQVAKAFHEDIGISSSLFPVDNVAPCEAQTCAVATAGIPDISDEGLDSVVNYLSVLSLPQQRHNPNEFNKIKQGWRLFSATGCIACHSIGLKTGKSDNPLLSEQAIHPFSDLLLHDMGEPLADRSTHELAREWRTPPLWGLGTAGGPYLHDGRANTLLEAILWHDGEAAASVEQVLRLNSMERSALLEFLAAL